ncbi:hypothetical protein BJ912DRAFT_71534 [Pholiota molesta]|nr:hypothetical protein BJ912DRAFT_71534 [Pholiota molesta]
MMLNESRQPRSPINELPTEILCEIFSRCVDQSSAGVLMQPNTQIAPMLLCHVCATWRAVVLSIPPFWSHLRFELPLNWHHNGHPFTGDQELFVRRVEWLRWWRRNLREMAPYLKIELRRKVGAKGADYQRGRLSESASEFLLELMSSAQYISVGGLYRYLVQWRTEAGYVVTPHPKAHTVVATWSSVLEFGGLLTYNQYLQSVFTQTSTLRCIAIENAKFGPREFASPLSNWAILTHLSTRMVVTDLHTWFSFIRSLSALQSGSFRISFQDSDVETYTRPSIGTLPCLTALHVDASQRLQTSGQYPLKAAFDNLQLPALRTLSLKSRGRTWYSSTALTELHAALMSAPAITTLSLGTFFLGGQRQRTDTEYSEPIRNDITTLAQCAPRLEHLNFAIESPLQQRRYNPASTIREVTFVSSHTSEAIDIVAEHPHRSLLVWEVRKFVKDKVVVRFEEEGPVQVGRAVWGS